MSENDKRGYREQAKADMIRYNKERIELEKNGIHLVDGKRKMQITLPKRRVADKTEASNLHWNCVKQELMIENPNSNYDDLRKVRISFIFSLPLDYGKNYLSVKRSNIKKWLWSM
jgi:hypothetical protein